MIAKDMAKSKSKTIYVCQNCGTQKLRWEGKCSDCGAWNSLVEETFSNEPVTRGWSVGKKGTSSKNHSPSSSTPLSNRPIRLNEKIENIDLNRMDTGIGELNRVLGGGLARGSYVLLGGSPGIGKSTLLMQMAGGLGKLNSQVLYVSGEESVQQTGSRAQRLGIHSENVQVAAESNLQTILDLARQEKPDVVIVDSIQTIFLPDLEAAPGSVSQVRECAGHLMGLAKTDGMTVILIGHVTKDGNIAGPKVLEHMVDCVLSFEGDLSHNFRLLRSLKNRFGATHELGVFQMNSLGLEEVENPSELFLEERGQNLIGSVVFASMEGTRPLLCEVQALTLNSPMPMPRRTALGIELNRLHLLGAVLDRHLEMKLNHSDVFINVVGGLKLSDPSSDLAVAAAILSTELRQSIDAHAVFFGEIGLTGEVRAVAFAELRLKEADKLGFNHFVLPYSNKKHLQDLGLLKGKKITWIKNMGDLHRFIKNGMSSNQKPLL